MSDIFWEGVEVFWVYSLGLFFWVEFRFVRFWELKGFDFLEIVVVFEVRMEV